MNNIEIADLVKYLSHTTSEKGNEDYAQYLFLVTMENLPKEKENAIRVQLARNYDLTSTYELEWANADIYTSGVYFTLEGVRTKASYFVNLNGEVGRKQKGEFLWNTDIETRDFDYDTFTADKLPDISLDSATELDSTSVDMYMSLYGLFIDDYDIKLSRVNLNGSIGKTDDYNAEVDNFLYKQLERRIKNNSVYALIEAYNDNDLFNIESDRKGYKMIIPLNDESKNFVFVVEIKSFKFDFANEFELDKNKSNFRGSGVALINMDAIKINTEGYDFIIGDTIPSLSGSELVNYLDYNFDSYTLYISEYGVNISTKDEGDFKFENEIIDSNKLVKEIIFTK